MNIVKLPEYSTERYYLLSEIEQKATFSLLDEEDRVLIKRPKFGCVYTLWNSEVSLELFQIELEKLVIEAEKYFEHFEYSLLSIEVLVPATVNMGLFLPKLQQLLTWANLKFAFGCTVIGVADSVAGTPALEKCYEYLEYLYKENEKAEISKVLLLVANRNELLGHDPTREPDAGSGIRQFTCTDMTSQPGGITTVDEWLKICKEHLISDAWMSTEEAVKEIKNEDAGMAYVLLIGVVGAIIASFAHVYFQNGGRWPF